MMDLLSFAEGWIGDNDGGDPVFHSDPDPGRGGIQQIWLRRENDSSRSQIFPFFLAGSAHVPADPVIDQVWGTILRAALRL